MPIYEEIPRRERMLYNGNTRAILVYILETKKEGKNRRWSLVVSVRIDASTEARSAMDSIAHLFWLLYARGVIVPELYRRLFREGNALGWEWELPGEDADSWASFARPQEDVSDASETSVEDIKEQLSHVAAVGNCISA